jgi:TRAP-type mannitol/chloroaromatic compound transport system permease small subunit
MQALLKISKTIDWISSGVGKLTMWLILITTLISAGNAVVRKIFNTSSNALLEIQWYLFAGVFMLGAGYCLLKNAHVRIDFIASRLSARARNWIDVIGILAVLFPFCLICIDLGWPLFVRAWESGEMSQSAGGLVRWPAYAMIPLGFALLLLQGISELIKRVAFLRGVGPDVLAHDDGPSEEEALAAAMAAQLEKAAVAPHPSKAG